MSTVQEIERAIQALKPGELEELYSWLDQYCPQPIDARIQLRCAYGDSREVGEVLQRVLVCSGENVWIDLYGHVLHQGTIYEATVAVAAWMVEALQTGKLGNRLIPIGKPFGKKDAFSERVLVFDLLSGIAEVGSRTGWFHK